MCAPKKIIKLVNKIISYVYLKINYYNFKMDGYIY